MVAVPDEEVSALRRGVRRWSQFAGEKISGSAGADASG